MAGKYASKAKFSRLYLHAEVEGAALVPRMGEDFALT